jgi:hypothetical protein
LQFTYPSSVLVVLRAPLCALCLLVIDGSHLASRPRKTTTPLPPKTF